MFGFATLSYLKSQAFDNECCGIVGYLGKDPKAGEILSQGIKILEARGYDSCGMVSVDKDGELVLTKHASEHYEGGDCI